MPHCLAVASSLNFMLISLQCLPASAPFYNEYQKMKHFTTVERQDDGQRITYETTDSDVVGHDGCSPARRSGMGGVAMSSHGKCTCMY